MVVFVFVAALSAVAAGCSDAGSQAQALPEIVDVPPDQSWCDQFEAVDVSADVGDDDAQGWTALVIDTTRSASSDEVREELVRGSVRTIRRAADGGDYLLILQATGDSVRSARTLFAGSLAGVGPNELFEGRDRDERALVAACALANAFETDQAPVASDLVGAIWRAARNDRRPVDDGRSCTFVLASDGVNNAAGIDFTRSDAVGAAADAGLLPDPDLEGCRLEITSLGRGSGDHDPSAGPALQAGWEAYAAAVGAEFVPDPSL